MIKLFYTSLLLIIFLCNPLAGFSQHTISDDETKQLADALQNRDFPLVQQLMEKRNQRADNISWGTKEAFMPLVFAVGFRLDDVTQELLSHPDYYNLKTKEGTLALEGACQKRNYSIAMKLIKQGADVNGKTAYDYPVFFEIMDDVSWVKLFLENGADAETKSANGNLLVCGGTSALQYAAMIGSRQTLSALIDHGAKLNEANDCGWTPLHYAAYGGSTEAVKFLLSKGANKEAKTSQKWEIYTNMMQNPYPAGSTPLGVAKISATNFSFADKKAEFEKILFYLSETKTANLKILMGQVNDSLQQGWKAEAGEGLSDEIIIRSQLIDLEPDMTSNDGPEMQGHCEIFIKMLPRVSPDSIVSLRKRDRLMQENLPPQNSKNNLTDWYEQNDKVLKTLDEEPTHYDNQYSYRIKCRRVPKNAVIKLEYDKIVHFLNRQFQNYHD